MLSDTGEPWQTERRQRVRDRSKDLRQRGQVRRIDCADKQRYLIVLFDAGQPLSEQRKSGGLSIYNRDARAGDGEGNLSQTI